MKVHSLVYKFYKRPTLQKRAANSENSKAYAERFYGGFRESTGSRKADYPRALPQPPRNAFDTLLPIKGLWVDMSIGVLHRLRAMRCNEVLLLDPREPE